MQILTTELDIPKTEPITIDHFTAAHRQLLEEGNTNIDHLLTNVRKDQRFEKILMRITAYDSGLLVHNVGIVELKISGSYNFMNTLYQHCNSKMTFDIRKVVRSIGL